MGRVKGSPTDVFETHKEKTEFLHSIRSKVVKYVHDHGIVKAARHWHVGTPRIHETLDYHRRMEGSPNMVIRKHKHNKKNSS